MGVRGVHEGNILPSGAKRGRPKLSSQMTRTTSRRLLSACENEHVEASDCHPLSRSQANARGSLRHDSKSASLLAIDIDSVPSKENLSTSVAASTETKHLSDRKISKGTDVNFVSTSRETVVAKFRSVRNLSSGTVALSASTGFCASRLNCGELSISASAVACGAEPALDSKGDRAAIASPDEEEPVNSIGTRSIFEYGGDEPECTDTILNESRNFCAKAECQLLTVERRATQASLLDEPSLQRPNSKNLRNAITQEEEVIVQNTDTCAPDIVVTPGHNRNSHGNTASHCIHDVSHPCTAESRGNINSLNGIQAVSNSASEGIKVALGEGVSPQQQESAQKADCKTPCCFDLHSSSVDDSSENDGDATLLCRDCERMDMSCSSLAVYRTYPFPPPAYPISYPAAQPPPDKRFYQNPFVGHSDLRPLAPKRRVLERYESESNLDTCIAITASEKNTHGCHIQGSLPFHRSTENVVPSARQSASTESIGSVEPLRKKAESSAKPRKSRKRSTATAVSSYSTSEQSLGVHRRRTAGALPLKGPRIPDSPETNTLAEDTPSSWDMFHQNASEKQTQAWMVPASSKQLKSVTHAALIGASAEGANVARVDGVGGHESSIKQTPSVVSRPESTDDDVSVSTSAKNVSSSVHYGPCRNVSSTAHESQLVSEPTHLNPSSTDLNVLIPSVSGRGSAFDGSLAPSLNSIPIQSLVSSEMVREVTSNHGMLRISQQAHSQVNIPTAESVTQDGLPVAKFPHSSSPYKHLLADQSSSSATVPPQIKHDASFAKHKQAEAPLLPGPASLLRRTKSTTPQRKECCPRIVPPVPVDSPTSRSSQVQVVAGGSANVLPSGSTMQGDVTAWIGSRHVPAVNTSSPLSLSGSRMKQIERGQTTEMHLPDAAYLPSSSKPDVHSSAKIHRTTNALDAEEVCDCRDCRSTYRDSAVPLCSGLPNVHCNRRSWRASSCAKYEDDKREILESAENVALDPILAQYRLTQSLSPASISLQHLSSRKYSSKVKSGTVLAIERDAVVNAAMYRHDTNNDEQRQRGIRRKIEQLQTEKSLLIRNELSELEAVARDQLRCREFKPLSPNDRQTLVVRIESSPPVLRKKLTWLFARDPISFIMSRQYLDGCVPVLLPCSGLDDKRLMMISESLLREERLTVTRRFYQDLHYLDAALRSEYQLLINIPT